MVLSSNIRIIIKGTSVFIAPLLLAFQPANAAGTKFSAGVVMEKMGAAERYTFVSGIVEGLAMARYNSDDKNPAGMECIYDWFYENGDVMGTIESAFSNFPDYPPGTVVDVLTRAECGG